MDFSFAAKIVSGVVQQRRATLHGVEQESGAQDTKPTRRDAGSDGTVAEQVESRLALDALGELLGVCVQADQQLGRAFDLDDVAYGGAPCVA